MKTAWGRHPRAGWRVYPRHRLDLTAGDLAYALGAALLARDADRREAELERTLGDDAVTAVSLRSGFALLLAAAELPAGSEVLLSAVTHPDMAAIVRRRGLVPVAVDIDRDTLAPRPEFLAAAVTPRTRALVVAHLFGGRCPLDEAVSVARRHGLLLLEDCAQSWRGPQDRGDPRADATMFSFGAIKTCPALGGAVLHVRRPDLRARMLELRRDRPRQTGGEYLARVLRFAVLHALANPWLYGALVRGGTLAGADVDALVNGSVRALRPPPPGAAETFERWLRRRPSAPLLAVLARRLRRFDGRRLRLRAEAGAQLAGSLPPGLLHPGGATEEPTHWVFPVVPPDPDRLIRELRAAGFDATRATSSIASLAPPPSTGAELMERVVFVPAYPELPPPAVRRLVEALEQALA